MSAGNRWHDGTPAEVDEPVVPQAILSWVRELGDPSRSASSQPAESVSADPAESPNENTLDSPETIAILLRAIEGTDLAALLEGVPLPGGGQSHGAEFATPPVTLKFAPNLEAPSAAPPPAASAQPEPASVAPLSSPAPARPEEIHDLAARLLSTIQSTDIASITNEQTLPAETAPQVVAAPQPAKPPEARNSATRSPATPPPVSIPPRPKSAPAPTPAAGAASKLPSLPILSAPVTPASKKPVAATHHTPVVAPPHKPAPIRTDAAISRIPDILRPGIRVIAAAFRPLGNALDRAEAELERWFLKWFEPPDPRHSRRLAKPPLVAYRWILNTPQAIKIANVSAGGLYLLTDERWSEGNIISMTLQRTDTERGAPDSWIAVDFVVMRRYKDGVAGAFIPSRPGLDHAVAGRAKNCADRKTLEQFFDQLSPTGNAPVRRHTRKILAVSDRIRRAISSLKDRLRRLPALVPFRSKASQQDLAGK